MIVIDLDTLKFSDVVQDVLEQTTDFTPLLTRLARECEEIWEEKFRAQGPGWAPLAKSTLERRRKDGKGAEILKDDGFLFDFLTAATGGGEKSIYELSATQMVIGTNLEYAAAHQDSQRDWLPKRPFLPEEDELVPVFETIIERWAKGLGGES